MEYYACVTKLMLLFACAYTVQCQDTQVQILEAPIVKVKEGGTKELTCHVNQGLTFVLDHKIVWVQVHYNKEMQRLTEQQSLLDSASPDDFGINFVHADKELKVILTIKKVKLTDDGEFMCQVFKMSQTEVLFSTSVTVTVYRDVESVELSIDDVRISTNRHEPLDRDEGEHSVSCSAKGFNPEANVELYLDTTLISGSTKVQISLDMLASQAANAHRYNALVRVPELTLQPDNRTQTIRCDATGNFPEAVLKSASIPLVVQVLEPTIICDQNASANIGDHYVKLSCLVVHSKVTIEHYQWEIGHSGERVVKDQISENYHQLKTEKLNETATHVTLELREVNENNFGSYYYLDATTQYGKTFRGAAVLRERPSSGGVRNVPLILLFLVSFLLSL